LEHGQLTGFHKEWLISMGSDIQSPAIFAKGYDFSMNHAVGLTPLKFCALPSKSLINLEETYLLPSAEMTCLLAYALVV
jgi:hypothetical protein